MKKFILFFISFVFWLVACLPEAKASPPDYGNDEVVTQNASATSADVQVVNWITTYSIGRLCETGFVYVLFQKVINRESRQIWITSYSMSHLCSLADTFYSNN